MTNMSLFHALLMILIAILTVLDIVTRGLPITRANFTVLNVAMIFSIILYVLDVATKGKYMRRLDEEEDLEKSGCDVTVKAADPFKDVPEGSYAELADRLREAFKEDDLHE